MAQRRLFSQAIVESDAFLDMPISSQALYFHLGMHADDDGFINPKKIMRMIGAPPDDLNVLLTKRFVLRFESGVVVIKHWLIHNTIRQDRYKETMYLEEKSLLKLKENKAYTELATIGLPSGNQMEPQVKLSKDKLSKDKEDKEIRISLATQSVAVDPVNEIISLFKEINPSYQQLFKNKSERVAVERLLKMGRDKLEGTIKYVKVTNGLPYAPTITTPIQLERDLGKLMAFYQKENKRSQKNKIAWMPII